MKKENNTLRGVGNVSEDYACKVLEKDGYCILCRNYTCRGGETDIIAAKGQYLCFIEVKSRLKTTGNVAAEAVDEKKMEHMRRSAECFLEEYRENEYVSSLIPRFDVIEIYTQNGCVKTYNHLTGII